MNEFTLRAVARADRGRFSSNASILTALAPLAIACLAVPAVAVPSITIAPGLAPSSYLSLGLPPFNLPAIAGMGDDSIADFSLPFSFTYAGESWSHLRIFSNGYVVVGPGNGAADNTLLNQNFPDAAIPNNVLAPFWTDLNPGAGGSIFLGTLSDGADSWIVIDWDSVPEFSTPTNLHSFEIWLGVDGDAHPGEDITFVYGDNTGNGDGGFLTIGAEDKTGTVGATYAFNETGTLPVSGTELRVTTQGFPATPEPATAALATIGLAGLIGSLLRRKGV